MLIEAVQLCTVWSSYFQRQPLLLSTWLRNSTEHFFKLWRLCCTMLYEHATQISCCHLTVKIAGYAGTKVTKHDAVFHRKRRRS